MKKYKYIIILALVFQLTCTKSTDITENDNNNNSSNIYAATVISSQPSSGATNIARDTGIQINFSTEMDKNSVIDALLIYDDNNKNILGYIEWNSDNKSFILHPKDILDSNTRYYVQLSSTAQTIDKTGKLKPYFMSFTTIDDRDKTPPSVESVSPNNNDTNVSVNIVIEANFSEAMDKTATQNSVEFFKNSEPNIMLSGSYSWNADSTQMNFQPSSALQYNTQYTFRITTTAKDLAGNTLQNIYEVEFTTSNAPDTTAPTINSTTPSDNSTGADLATKVYVNFSETMNTTQTASAFSIKRCDTTEIVSGSISWENGNSTLVFTPSDNLFFGKQYCINITTTAQDAAGNALSSQYNFDFYAETFENSKEKYVRKFAPELHLTKYGTDGDGGGLEWTRPANIDWYFNTGHYDGGDLIGASMRFNHDGCADCVVASVGSVDRNNIAGWQHNERGSLCIGHSGDVRYSNQIYSSDLTDARFFLQPRKGSGEGSDYDKMHHGIYGGPNGDNPSLFSSDGAGEDSSDLIAKGVYPDNAPAVGKWVMYAHILESGDDGYPSRFGGYRDIQYWFFYTYNDSIASFNHESDWEHLTVSINEQGKIIAVFMSEHDGGTKFIQYSGCASGFRSEHTMKVNGSSSNICMLATTEDNGFHPIAYSADGSHANYPLGNSSDTYNWDGYAGGFADYTTKDGPVWKGWLVDGSNKNYEVVTNSTVWTQYAGIWGEVGSTNVTTGKRGPRWQGWGKDLEDNAYGDK